MVPRHAAPHTQHPACHLRFLKPAGASQPDLPETVACWPGCLLRRAPPAHTLATAHACTPHSRTPAHCLTWRHEQAANVPCVPGSDGLIESDQQAIDLCNEIGFPVMIKATAGEARGAGPQPDRRMHFAWGTAAS